MLSVVGGVTDAATLCAALLHDTVKDTDTTPADIETAFGAEIRSIVDEVTDDKTLLKLDRKRAQVEHAAHIRDEAKLVKLADKICDIRDVANSPPAPWPLQRRQEYFGWARAVIDQMRDVNRCRRPYAGWGRIFMPRRPPPELRRAITRSHCNARVATVR